MVQKPKLPPDPNLNTGRPSLDLAWSISAFFPKIFHLTLAPSVVERWRWLWKMCCLIYQTDKEGNRKKSFLNYHNLLWWHRWKIKSHFCHNSNNYHPKSFSEIHATSQLSNIFKCKGIWNTWRSYISSRIERQRPLLAWKQDSMEIWCHTSFLLDFLPHFAASCCSGGAL